MKHLFIILSIIACSFFIGCASGPDPIANCNSVILKTTFIDSANGRDLIGDTSSRYNKDSIKYIISSVYDTTDIQKITVNQVGLYNECSLKYTFGYNYGYYKVIFLLNATESDTISFNVIDDYTIEYSYKNTVLRKGNYDCAPLSHTIKK